MQIPVNSANISVFSFTVKVNLYTRQVVFDASSTTYNGSGINVVQGIAFSLVDQDGVTLASIDFAAPQIPTPSISQTWTLDLSNVNYAFLFQTYQIIGAIKDQNGTIYQTAPVYKKVCQPVDINENGYVPGIFQLTPDCVNNVLTVKELTRFSYNGLTPSSVTKSGNLYYPTGTISPVAISNTPFSNNAIYTGSYRINNTSVSEYDLQDGFFVDVTYITNCPFSITCTDKIADLLCCIVGIQSIAKKNCENAIGQHAKQQLDDITIPFLTGLAKEINGQDASEEAKLIRKTLNCDCGISSITQNELTPINPAVTHIVLNGVGGTTIPPPTITGSTQTYNIASKIYSVVKGNNLDTSFTITVDNSVINNVKYLITFDYVQLTTTILTTISNNPTLKTLLNSLISVAGGGSIQGLNGKCVIDLTRADYTIIQAVQNTNVVSNIVINGTTYNAPSALSATDTVGIAAWLNGLTLGAFSVSINSMNLLVQTLSNSNTVSTISFTGPSVTTQFISTNATLVQVLQAIIDYLCGITDFQIALSGALSLCTFDYNGNIINTTYSASLKGFNVGVSQAICNLANRMNALTGITCSKLQAIFLDNPGGSFGANDRLYGTLGGICSGLTDLQVANLVIAAVGKYSSVKTAWCAIDCTTPGTCPDVSTINAAPIPGGIGIYGVNWLTATVSTQSATVKYRLASSSTYTTATTNLLIQPNGNVSGTSPFPISGLTAGQIYVVSVVNNCGGSGATMQITVPNSTVYSGSFLLDNSIYAICGNSPVTLYSNVPFATGVTMYQDSGLTIPRTGFIYIADSTGTIYNINTSTGVVGISTGSNCSAGTPGTYQLGNAIPAVCSASTITLYTNGSFAPGLILYTDVALTNPVTGNIYVVNTANNHIFNLNNSTGLIGSDTGTLCTGTAILTLSFTNAGGSFLSFQANLSRPVDANTNINQVFSDGFSNSSCAGGAVASAQITMTPLSISAGSTGTGRSPENTTGSWASANHYKMYNVNVNGTPVINGSVVTIGSFLVTLVIPACN